MSNLSFDFFAQPPATPPPIDTMKAWAQWSSCGTYRYILGRRGLGGDGRILVVGCNPSKAGRDDPAREDNTSTRCVGFAVRERADTLVMANPFAYGATDPKDLVKAWRDGKDIIGPDNDRQILREARLATKIIMGCGAPHSYGPKPFQVVFRRRVEEVVRLLTTGDLKGTELWCLGTTAENWPRHPRLLPKDAPLVPWSMP